MLNSIVSNSHFWKRPGARDMTIFMSHVGPHIPNNGYLEVYGGIWGLYKYMEVYESICGYMGVYEGMKGLRPGEGNGVGGG